MVPVPWQSTLCSPCHRILCGFAQATAYRSDSMSQAQPSLVLTECNNPASCLGTLSIDVSLGSHALGEACCLTGNCPMEMLSWQLRKVLGQQPARTCSLQSNSPGELRGLLTELGIRSLSLSPDLRWCKPSWQRDDNFTRDHEPKPSS